MGTRVESTGAIEYRVDAPACAAINMDRDRALWRSVEEGERRSPFLRVYAWSPPALSLGFHQRITPDQRERFAACGLDVVRRPTGGAAVLHDQEITYAVAAPLGSSVFGESVGEIYDSVAGALVAALARFGVHCDRGGGGRPMGFACFSAAGGHEITVGGRKLVGSALRRGRRAFLQHGSLLCGPGHLRIADLSRDEDPTVTALASRTTDLSQIGGGISISPEDFAAALAEALDQALG